MTRLQFLLLLFAATTLTAAEPTRHVLVIGVDGTRLDALQKANTPHFDRMIAEGGISEDCQILGQRYQGNETISGPGWSSILTGVWADKHGVNDNSFEGKNYDRYPHFFSRIPLPDSAAATVSFDSWKPLHEHLIGPARNVLRSESIEQPDRTPIQLDQHMEKLAVEQLAQSGPKAMFVYFHQIDTTGHAHGFHPEVPQYIEAIVNVDRHLAGIMRAVELRARSKSEDWLIITCTDHGGRGTTHSGGHELPEIRQAFLILWQPGRKIGRKLPSSEIVDIAPTALAHLRIPLDPAWDLDGKPLSLRSDTSTQPD
jgi:hypothetical protein